MVVQYLFIFVFRVGPSLCKGHFVGAGDSFVYSYSHLDGEATWAIKKYFVNERWIGGSPIFVK